MAVSDPWQQGGSHRPASSCSSSVSLSSRSDSSSRSTISPPRRRSSKSDRSSITGPRPHSGSNVGAEVMSLVTDKSADVHEQNEFYLRSRPSVREQSFAAGMQDEDES